MAVAPIAATPKTKSSIESVRQHELGDVADHAAAASRASRRRASRCGSRRRRARLPAQIGVVAGRLSADRHLPRSLVTTGAGGASASDATAAALTRAFCAR